MKKGDLVRLRDGSAALIVEIVSDNPSWAIPMARKYPWAILHSGEKISIRDLEVVVEKG